MNQLPRFDTYSHSWPTLGTERTCSDGLDHSSHDDLGFHLNEQVQASKGNTYRAFELAPELLHGIVNVNSPTVNDEIHAPMGGVRDSGWGRTGPDSLKEFQDVIWINSHSGQRQYPI